ncbi:polysaccharide deacetylase family protein [Saccharopolyspora mangrovi]|uniref:Polysaccharide deacetylase n=1 Tax=Saccharopolyspora mangrovi TaxID=3082379 RepID=A0ABU6AGE9_9PSEU|nr:polysaccharide deacetylase [Saccharopolyspora sp. S2-29]MEB3370532.1 polysaccharide deacetylase [Saccharopolyspora sp. S2-29]
MPLRLPAGTRLAVSIGPDFDAQSVWTGTFKSASQSHLSRGEFGAEVAVPRLLRLFDRYGFRTTWCTPTHTMQTFPAAFRSIVDAGHEIAAHGVCHEPIVQLEPDEERRLMQRQIRLHEQIVGVRPKGYRSPAFDVSDVTFDLLEEFGFTWDSSLMGRDFEVYRPRLVTRIDPENGNSFGPPRDVLEIPVSWYLDDFPALEFLPRSTGMQSTEAVLQRWIDSFRFAREQCEGGVYVLTVHPQTIGRAHHLVMLERFLDEVTSHDDVWLATLSEIAGCWYDD